MKNVDRVKSMVVLLDHEDPEFIAMLEQELETMRGGRDVFDLSLFEIGRCQIVVLDKYKLKHPSHER